MKTVFRSAEIAHIWAHTPGPWSWQRQPHRFRLLSAKGEDAGLAVKILSAEDEVWPESANARLIAAAPELLEALHAALESLAADAEHEEHNGGAGEAVHIYCQARAAIARATGGKS